MLADRVQCAVTSTGTGTASLGAATAGFRTFSSAFSASATVQYVIVDGVAWETGRGTFDRTANTITRGLAASSTGALLNLSGTAVISNAFLAGDNVSDWPNVVVGRLGGPNPTDSFQQVGNSQGFTTVQLGGPATIDTHGGWNASTHMYTVQQTGIYDLVGKVRYNDSTPAGLSHCTSVDTTNADSPDANWFTTVAATASPQYTNFVGRHGNVCIRQMALTVGQQVRLITLMDSGTARGIGTASLNIARVR